MAQAADRGPVVVIGVDGMSFDVLDPLIAEGKTPNLARLKETGAWGQLKSEKPMRSPAIWTTLATGYPREAHGIYDFVTGSRYWPEDQRDVEQQLVTSAMRKKPALWSLLSAAEKRTLVVGWLNTWPAEKIRGEMVAPYVALGKKKQTSIKGKIYKTKTARRQAHPPSLYKQSVRPNIVTPSDVTPEQIARLVDVPPADSPLFTAVPRLKRFLYTVRWSIASTLTNTAIIEDRLQNGGDFDLVMTYFDGSDTLAHRFWLLRQSLEDIRARLKGHDIDPAFAEELKARFHNAVSGYYEMVDEMIGRIVAAAGPDATVVVISDHGWGDLRRDHALHHHVPFDGVHKMQGVFLAAGSGVRGGEHHGLTLYEVVPTVLRLTGVLPPDALPGTVPEGLLDATHLAPGVSVSLAKEKPAVAAPTEAAPTHFEDTEVERLRSLGYVQ